MDVHVRLDGCATVWAHMSNCLIAGMACVVCIEQASCRSCSVRMPARALPAAWHYWWCRYVSSRYVLCIMLCCMPCLCSSCPLLLLVVVLLLCCCVGMQVSCDYVSQWSEAAVTAHCSTTRGCTGRVVQCINVALSCEFQHMQLCCWLVLQQPEPDGQLLSLGSMSCATVSNTPLCECYVQRVGVPVLS